MLYALCFEFQHYLILNKPYEEENEARQKKYVFMNNDETKVDVEEEADKAGMSEKTPMLASAEEEDASLISGTTASPMSNNTNNVASSFFNPTYQTQPNPVRPRPRGVEARRQQSSRSLLAYKVSQKLNLCDIVNLNAYKIV